MNSEEILKQAASLNEEIENSELYKEVKELEAQIDNNDYLTKLIDEIIELQKENVEEGSKNEILETKLTLLYNDELYTKYIPKAKELNELYEEINSKLISVFNDITK